MKKQQFYIPFKNYFYLGAQRCRWVSIPLLTGSPTTRIIVDIENSNSADWDAISRFRRP